MVKFIALFFGTWYLLSLVFPSGSKGVGKNGDKIVPLSTPAEQATVADSDTVRYMTSMINSRINAKLSTEDAHCVARAVVAASHRFELNPHLILGVIYAESNAYPWAINGGSLGLMQVMPKWWDGELRKQGIIKKRDDYFNIKPAVMAGSFVLRLCLDRAGGDVRKALDYYTGKASSQYIKKVFSIINLNNGGR